MRINRLELQAFGPFYKREEILFSELYDSSIFLISGKTGSGKTTIFDAICFALFGESSADRDSKSLKSDFAEELETYVIIEFELDDTKYQIKRYPADQRINTERGSRNLKNQEVTLTYKDKTLKGAVEVKTFIVDLLGVNADQFKKIVMLPQGKFKELLFATTSEKGEIFRTIFGTERLSVIMSDIRNRYNSIKKNYDDSIRDKTKILDDFECEDELSVVEQINKDVQDIKNIDLKINEYGEKVTLLKEQIFKSEDTNKKINDYKNAVIQFEKLMEQSELFNNYRWELIASSIAKENKKLYNEINLLKDDISLTSIEIKDKSFELNELSKKFESIKIADDDILRCREGIEVLNNNLVEFDKINSIYNEMLDIKPKLDNKVIEQNKMVDAISLNKTTDEDIKECRDSIKLYENESIKLENLLKEVKLLMDLELKLKNCLVECSESIAKVKNSNEELLELKNAYNNELATQLSLELEIGKPCPVCGSLEHPNIAVSTGNLVTKNMIDMQQNERDRLSIALAKVETSRDKYIIDIEKKEADITLYGMNYYTINEIEEQLEHVKEILVNKRSNLTDLEKLLGDKNRMIQTLSGLNSTVKLLDENYDKLKENLAKINNHNYSREEIVEKLSNTKFLLMEAKLSLKELEKSSKEKLIIKDSITNIQSQLKVLDANLVKYRNKLQIDQLEFSIILDDNFESNIDKFIKYLEIDDKLLKQAIDEYQNDLTWSRTTIENLLEYKDIEFVNLDDQNNELSSIANELTRARENRDIVNNRNIINNRNVETLNKLQNEIEELEKQYAIIEKINNVAQGKYNSENINFETHVLAVFYEEVLELTNNKLKELSRGRYQLRRKSEKSGGGKQGLDTTIFDLTTGKERSISSVSGGESFMISLALALSLSEITQMNSNSVDIETLFIDEGFGTLDPESLEITIDLLLELNQNGKLVGIISHVKELQDRINAKLIIETSKNGSYIKEIIY